MSALRYNNTSVPVVLGAAITDTDDTLSVGSTSSYPEPPFLLGVDRGTGDEEVMLCTAKTTTTFTVTRGYDSTTAVSHAVGAIVEHASAAITHRRGSIAQVTTVERDALSGVDRWNGRTIWNTDTSKLQYFTGSVWANVGPRAGAIEMFGGAAAPTGALLCQGQAVSRTTYADLFAAIATTFGAGDGSTTFNLPDLRQKFPVGAQAGGDYDLGDIGGAASITLTNAQVPSHTHNTGNHSHNVAGNTSGDNHSHNIGSDNHVHNMNSDNHGHNTSSVAHNHDGRFRFFAQGAGNVEFWTAVLPAESAGTTQITQSTNTSGAHAHNLNTDNHVHNMNSDNHAHNLGSDNHSHNVSGNTAAAGSAATSSVGSGGSHENRPPFIALNFIIYT